MSDFTLDNTRREVEELDRLLVELFPLTRSLTGSGNRETLRILQGLVPLEIFEYQSGSSVYDWIVPDEWVIKDAYIESSSGTRIVDFKESNLHVVGYSTPVDARIEFEATTPSPPSD